MKIVADENMPLVEDYFSEYGEIVRLPGRNLTPEDVKDADILLVRSVTKVNRELLEHSKVKFVATATIGTDHLDKKYLEENGIEWHSAPGCNADSVAEYVVSVIAYLCHQYDFDAVGKCAGIVGCGNVGSRVKGRLETLGMEVLSFDPPKEIRESEFKSASLSDLYDCDFISLHAPLTEDGDCPSYHMVAETFFNKLNKEAFVLSAGRGPVIDFKALESVDLSRFILDVWEPEPDLNKSIMEDCFIASPHVAGYSLQSKWRGTQMVYQSAAKYFGWNVDKKVNYPVKAPVVDLEGLDKWYDVVIKLYNAFDDSNHTKEMLKKSRNISQTFDQLRKNYPLRHEFSFPEFQNAMMPSSELAILKNLGFRI